MNKTWMWNEFKQVGTDYANRSEVEIYDQRMRAMRDIDGENEIISHHISWTPPMNVLEIGCGTGSWIRSIASKCNHATALDISQTMLNYAQNKAQEAGLKIEFIQAGFLSFQYPPSFYKAVVSSLTMHHLPDVWKALAFQKIYDTLTMEGVFVLVDIIFNTDARHMKTYFESFLANCDVTQRPNILRHINTEYSTFPWVIQKLAEQAGFKSIHEQNITPYFKLWVFKK